MSARGNTAPRRVLQTYYAATIVFLVLDYGAGLNLRIAGWRSCSDTGARHARPRRRIRGTA